MTIHIAVTKLVQHVQQKVVLESFLDKFWGRHSDLHLAFERNHAFINRYFLMTIIQSFKLLLQDKEDWPNFVQSVYQRQDHSRLVQQHLDHKNVNTFSTV